MSIVYQRTGGFAGMNDVLRVDPVTGVELTRRNQPVSKRALSAEEKQTVGKLIAAAKAAPVPAPPAAAAGRRIPDSFNYSLTFNDEAAPRLQLTTPGRPSATGEPWMDLLGWMEELMAAEIQRSPP